MAKRSPSTKAEPQPLSKAGSRTAAKDTTPAPATSFFEVAAGTPPDGGGSFNALLAVAGLALFVVAATVWLIPPWPMPADAGEFQFVTRHLGIAHPPGYALYTMVGHVFGRLLLTLTAGNALSAITGQTADPWAWSQNVLALVLAIATLWSVASVGRRLSGGAAAGWLGALLLAATPTFLAQATVAGIRMPTALLTALFLGVVLRFGHPSKTGDAGPDGPPGLAWSALAGLVFGLAIGHHPTLVLLAIPWLVMTMGRPRTRHLLHVGAGLVGLAIGLLPLVYLPIRDAAAAVLAPGGLTTPAGLLAHVSGYAFRGDALYFGDLPTLMDRLAVLANILGLELGVGLVLILLGAIWLWRVDRRRMLALGAFALASAASAVAYRAPQTVEYLMPCYVALALLASGSVPAVGTVVAWRRRLREAAAAVTASYEAHDGAPDPVSGVGHLDNDQGTSSGQGLASGEPDRAMSAPVDGDSRIVGLASALLVVRALWLLVLVGQANAAQAGHAWLPFVAKHRLPTLASWHFVTPAWVAASRLETDPRAIVDRIQYVWPDGDEAYGRTWLRRLVDTPASVVVATNRTTDTVAAGVPSWPLAFQSGYLTITRPPTETFGGYPTLPESVPSLPLTPTNNVMLSPGSPRAVVRLADADVARMPGKLVVRLQWIAQSPVTSSVTGWAQLVDPADGRVWAQADQPLGQQPMPVSDLEAIRYAQLELVPFRGSVPRRLRLLVGLYTSTAEGPQRWLSGPGDAIDLGSIALLPAPLSQPWDIGGLLPGLAPSGTLAVRPVETTASEVPFGNVMTLESVRVQTRPGTAITGDGGSEVIVDLAWRCDGPPDSDYTISVQLSGEGWKAQDDGTPALGAIPTLKWLPGMRIHDRHRVKLPPGASPADGFSVRLAVYDAFSLDPLPVADAQRVRQGEGQSAVVWP